MELYLSEFLLSIMTQDFHIPVLLQEVINFLGIKKDCWYIDCNLGGGGHTKAILQKGGKVLGIDVDPDAISEARKCLDKISSDRIIFCQNNFIHLKRLIQEYSLKQVSGILFDLGVSSYQFDNPTKGFSFRPTSPLDMRMDPALRVKAGDLVHGLNAGELEELFTNLGEEPFAKRIAQAIVVHRKLKPLKTAKELVDVILTVKHRSHTSIHPATLVFQALRIAVNDELNSLKAALPQAVDILKPGGKLVVISFHSLEDRVVKDFFREQQQKNVLQVLTKKPVTPNVGEISNNPRSRSAKLRAAMKLHD